MVSRIGILTGGGDCPGLNAAIRAVVRRADQANVMTFGFAAGWRGVLDASVEQLTLSSTRGLLHRGGTILGTSRVDPYREPDGVARIAQALDVHRLDGLVVIGGEGTLSAATRLADEGIPIVGIPKTIDNDVAATELTIGFLTAVRTATEAVDRLHSTAESHNRVMVLEVMGRHAGWIATYAGMAGGADAILVPEVPFDMEAVGRHLRHRAGSGRDFSIVVVAEGALPREGTMEVPEPPKDEFGRPRLGGIGHAIAHEIEHRTGFPARVTILGHVQRGGSPTPMDRVLATRMGVEAAELAMAGTWGRMTAFEHHEVVPVALADATAELKTVPASLYRVAETFFG
ncbi:6-phosphofructokinase [Egicoccus halophilus]|uniref:ATP-dependent 6-phosphofructokinase n=1 Tax=Egicoccus halophilus TaxID=1670830 RepID=A0A8J3ETD6_9ACTN|nr:ATP-dependent 6-phosphofructokinase [Egicoccus halophilus]GGI04991.1 ATP-dependent 6-phosphofructokinase [Egicoccus halophilus]